MEFIIIYSKNKKIKALGVDAAKREGKGLLYDGWLHTATLDPCGYLEYLCNSSPNIEQDVYKLLEDDL